MSSKQSIKIRIFEQKDRVRKYNEIVLVRGFAPHKKNINLRDLKERVKKFKPIEKKLSTRYYSFHIWLSNLSVSKACSFYILSVLLTLFIIFLTEVNISQAQKLQKEYKLLWSCKVDKWISDVSVSSNSSYIAVGAGDKVCLVNREGEPLWIREIEGKNVWEISISSDGLYIALGESSYINLFSQQGKLLWNYYYEKVSEWVNEDIRAVSVSSDGSYIAEGMLSGKISMHDKGGELLWSYHIYGEDKKINGISISSDGSYIVAVTRKVVYFFAPMERSINNIKLILDQVWSAISQEKAKNVIITAAESLFSQSEDAYKKGDYTKAKELAEQAKSNTLKIEKEANDANLLIKKTNASIFKDEYSYIKNSSVEILLESLSHQYEEAFKKGEYAKAYLLAAKGYRLSLDIDQDEVLNKDDFAPKIKNIYIYIYLIILLLIILIYITRKWVIRNKRKQYEVKLKQWEVEGYKVSKFQDKLFKIKHLCKMIQEFEKFEKKLNSLSLEDTVKSYFPDN